MKNNIFYTSILFLIFFSTELTAKEFEINSTKVQFDNVNKITIFEGNVNTKDQKGNKIFSEYTKYNELEGLAETKGKTKVITSEGFEVLSSNVFLDDKKKLIYSNYKTQIKDKDGNKIIVDMFSYSILTNIFFSKGNIKILDVNNNIYNFSEIYVDEKKKKIIGSDVKAFLKQDGISLNKENEPRFFANTATLSEKNNKFEKGIFTYCKNREDGKCPPWTLQSKKINHDLATKTIYYENVVLKVYDFPIFFSPKFSHPDPTVKRRSGLLAPSLSNSSTVGSGVNVPYFWNIGNDRDLTFTPKLYLNENPLLLTEYRQDFKNSFMILDTGYTKGYKRSDNKKTSGSRNHFFARFNKNFIDEDKENSNLEIDIQNVSNDTYFKVHDLETTLVNKDSNIIENKINFSYQNEDLFFGLTPGIYEDMNKTGHSRHEYLLPLTVEKNIMSSARYGFLNLESNLKLRNYETNKKTNFFVNDFNWKSNKWLNNLGIESYFEGLIKTVNYESKNADNYKNDNTNTELNSAIGYFAKLGLYKNDFVKKNLHTLTPKVLLRYAPGHMRNVDGSKFNYGNLFNLNKINKLDIVENGLSSSIGFEYKKKKLDKTNNIDTETLSFSVGQVISAKENMDIPSSTSLDQKFSDIVGEGKYNINNNVGLKYNFAIDQGYKNFNYNEIGSDISFEKAKFNVSYLQEKNHVGNQEFIQSGLDFTPNDSTLLSFSSKRNLLTSSAEFYNMSYNYINDCLKAGIAYRREFYTDRDIEPTNTLMFTISIIPFAAINSPGLNK
ncbi:hypothetical protein OAM15_00605 [Pelagibacteraceae bacterium]|nr:hypothetical protein [Pelagibacteraceae bacterium]